MPQKRGVGGELSHAINIPFSPKVHADGLNPDIIAAAETIRIRFNQQ